MDHAEKSKWVTKKIQLQNACKTSIRSPFPNRLGKNFKPWSGTVTLWELCTAIHNNGQIYYNGRFNESYLTIVRDQVTLWRGYYANLVIRLAFDGNNLVVPIKEFFTLCYDVVDNILDFRGIAVDIANLSIEIELKPVPSSCINGSLDHFYNLFTTDEYSAFMLQVLTKGSDSIYDLE